MGDGLSGISESSESDDESDDGDCGVGLLTGVDTGDVPPD